MHHPVRHASSIVRRWRQWRGGALISGFAPGRADEQGLHRLGRRPPERQTLQAPHNYRRRTGNLLRQMLASRVDRGAANAADECMPQIKLLRSATAVKCDCPCLMLHHMHRLNPGGPFERRHASVSKLFRQLFCCAYQSTARGDLHCARRQARPIAKYAQIPSPYFPGRIPKSAQFWLAAHRVQSHRPAAAAAWRSSGSG